MVNNRIGCGRSVNNRQVQWLIFVYVAIRNLHQQVRQQVKFTRRAFRPPGGSHLSYFYLP